MSIFRALGLAKFRILKTMMNTYTQIDGQIDRYIAR